MLGFCPLGSGSKGNCIYVGTKETKILIDAGLSAKTIAARLAEIGVDIKDIEAVLVTHEHTDHILGLQKLACKESLPVFANSEMSRGSIAHCKSVLSLRSFRQERPFLLVT